MSWSFSIGRLFGSELRVHATFFLLLIWIGAAAWINSGPQAAVVNIAFILALFACVVAHEFGHALMARRFGVRTPDITLLPIGGMARLERIPEKPAEEIAVAVAGPAVNVVIWAVLTLFLGAGTHLDALQNIDDTGQGFVARLAAVNLFLVLFNLIPAFPMDGGRVLRAALAIPYGRVKATRLASAAGQFLAFGFGFVGLTSGNPLLLLIAVFVFLAAAAENSDVALHAKTHNVPARDAMITTFEALTPTDTLDSAGRALVRTTQAEFPVLTDDRVLAGFLTRATIMSAMERHAAATPVGDLMDASVPSVRLDDPLDNAIAALSGGAPAVAVNDRAGHFLGYITRENIGEWMVVSRS
ncbi:MAG: site-2 protease family protein [Marinibacterium sp.]